MELPLSLSITGTILGSLLVIIGLFGNGLIMAAIAWTKQLRKIPNIPIASQCLSFSIPLLLVYPLHVHTYRLGYWPWEEGMCVYTFIMNSGCVVSTIMHMILVALYRYALIVHPKFYKKLEKKKVLIPMLLLCQVPYINGIFSKWSFIRGKEINVHRFTVIAMYCVTEDGSGTIWVLAGFLFGFLILAYFYIRIYWTVRRSRRRIAAVNRIQRNTNLRGELALVKVMLVTFVLYTVSYIPWPLAYYLAGESGISAWLWLLLNLLLWSSCATTWLVYGLLNTQFRSAYKSLIGCLSHKGPNRTDPVRSVSKNTPQPINDTQSARIYSLDHIPLPKGEQSNL